MKRGQVLKFVIIDMFAICFAYALALFIRFDGDPIIYNYFLIGIKHILIIMFIKIISFRYFKLYKILW